MTIGSFSAYQRISRRRFSAGHTSRTRSGTYPISLNTRKSVHVSAYTYNLEREKNKNQKRRLLKSYLHVPPGCFYRSNPAPPPPGVLRLSGFPFHNPRERAHTTAKCTVHTLRGNRNPDLRCTRWNHLCWPDTALNSISLPSWRIRFRSSRASVLQTFHCVRVPIRFDPLKRSFFRHVGNHEVSPIVTRFMPDTTRSRRPRDLPTGEGTFRKSSGIRYGKKKKKKTKNIPRRQCTHCYRTRVRIRRQTYNQEGRERLRKHAYNSRVSAPFAV